MDGLTCTFVVVTPRYWSLHIQYRHSYVEERIVMHVLPLANSVLLLKTRSINSRSLILVIVVNIVCVVVETFAFREWHLYDILH